MWSSIPVFQTQTKNTVSRYLYSILSYLLLPAIVLRLYLRSLSLSPTVEREIRTIHGASPARRIAVMYLDTCCFCGRSCRCDSSYKMFAATLSTYNVGCNHHDTNRVWAGNQYLRWISISRLCPLWHSICHKKFLNQVEARLSLHYGNRAMAQHYSSVPQTKM